MNPSSIIQEYLPAACIELKRRNWSDEKIGRELGMDADEVLSGEELTSVARAYPPGGRAVERIGVDGPVWGICA